MLVVICGGGPGGATTAQKLAQEGIEVVLLEKSLSRIKPCGGAIPPALVREFDIPHDLIERHVETVTAFAPSGKSVRLDMPNGCINMVSREKFDTFLRDRATQAGALILEARVETVDATERGALVTFITPNGKQTTLQADCIVGADGANSFVARKLNLHHGGLLATAVQERFERQSPTISRLADRCEIFYDSRISPDLYGWLFPKEDHILVGMVTSQSNANLNTYLDMLKHQLGINEIPVLREGAQIPLRPVTHWTANRVVLIGDAAGLVAASSGEGIYYAMKSGAMAAEAIIKCAADLRAEKLEAAYQKPFKRQFGPMFRRQEAIRNTFYKNDGCREALVTLYQDPDLQNQILQSYLFKRAMPMPLLTALKLKMKNAYHLTKAALGHYNPPPTSHEPLLLP